MKKSLGTSLNAKQTSNSRKVINLPFKTTLRTIMVLGKPRLSLQNNARSKLGRTVGKSQFFGYISETTPSFILRELRWHETRERERRKRGTEVEAELRRKAKLYERIDHDRLTNYTCKILQTCNIVFCCETTELVIKAVIRTTEAFNLHRNNVARQVEENFCPHYRTLTTAQ